MAHRQDIVAIARSWKGTPDAWQASVKGVGCDCKGLIWGIAREVGLPEADSWYAKVCDYSVFVPVNLLREGLASHFDLTDDPQPGDLLLLKVGSPRKPQHLAVYVGGNRMIHTYGHFGVIEVPMGKIWWQQMDSAWTWRGIQ